MSLYLFSKRLICPLRDSVISLGPSSVAENVCSDLVLWDTIFFFYKFRELSISSFSTERLWTCSLSNLASVAVQAGSSVVQAATSLTPCGSSRLMQIAFGTVFWNAELLKALAADWLKMINITDIALVSGLDFVGRPAPENSRTSASCTGNQPY